MDLQGGLAGAEPNPVFIVLVSYQEDGRSVLPVFWNAIKMFYIQR